MDWYLVSFIVFVFAAAALVYRNRKSVTNKYYIFYRYDTEKGKDFIDRVAKSHPSLWRFLGNVGIFVGFGGMLFGAYYIINSYVTYLIAPELFAPTLNLVIPIPFGEIAFVPGFLGVPFWYWLIPVAILVFFHEGMHAILARVENIRIKTLGVFLLAIIPGAFVEPDEKQLKKAGWKSRMRVYAGGSFANITIGLVFLFMISSFYLPTFYDESVGFGAYYVTENGTALPAQEANMTGSIYSVNGERVRNVDDLSGIMETLEPGETIRVTTVRGSAIAPLFDRVVAKNPEFTDYEITTADDGKPVMGIARFYSVSTTREGFSNPGLLEFLTGLLIWICIINFGVGVVNMLPIKPLDGGLMLEAMGERFAPKHYEKIIRGLSLFFLFLIVGNFIIGFI